MSPSEFWNLVEKITPAVLVIAAMIHGDRIRTLERKVKSLEGRDE